MRYLLVALLALGLVAGCTAKKKEATPSTDTKVTAPAVTVPSTAAMPAKADEVKKAAEGAATDVKKAAEGAAATAPATNVTPPPAPAK